MQNAEGKWTDVELPYLSIFSPEWLIAMSDMYF